jgi:SAM-dependent methyltransferase
MPMDPHRRTNYANWEDRVAIHAASRTYDVAGLAADPTRLTRVIQRDRERLPELTGKDVVHLQCHIGTDTLSLARLGAASVTGYDFSPSALEVARGLAAEAGAAIDYVQGELYDAVDVLGRHRFDVVYTGAGALNWLPDIGGWAAVVAGLLRPGGVLHLHEGHPVLWSLDDRDDDLLVIGYPYFETPDPISFDEGPATYTDGDTSGMTHTATREWNHGLGEIVQAVIDAGLVVTMLRELQYCDWLALPSVMEVTDADGGAVLTDRPERLPLTYTLQARTPGHEPDVRSAGP